jgi:hypothetical protein
LVQFENHLPRLDFTFSVIDMSRAWYEYTPLKECRK